MRFTTENEMHNFDFAEGVLQGVEKRNDHVDVMLANVKILGTNSCNRDIVSKRTNDLVVRIAGSTWRLYEEGYQLFDADLRPVKTVEDRQVKDEDVQHDLDLFTDCFLDGFEKQEKDGAFVYVMSLRVEDHTWRLEIDGTKDTEMWDRFLSL